MDLHPSDLTQLHFLRPAWLLLLVPGALIAGSTWLRQDAMHAWRGVIAPHLLEALLLGKNASRGKLRPVHLLAGGLLIGTLALAGPTWKMQPAPFVEDRAAVFILIKVTPEMQAQDIQPSRLQRSVQKLGDFLAIKKGIRVGLIAYAGSAHLAMPLTSDTGIIVDFASALEPEIMPVSGNDVVAALVLANEQLSRAGVPGSIVLFADEIDTGQLDELAVLREEGGVPVHILAVAAGPEVVPPPGSPVAPALNLVAMRDALIAAGGTLTVVTADAADVEKLARNVERGIRDAPAQEGQQWQDMGFWLLPLLALILLIFFRPGGALVLE